MASASNWSTSYLEVGSYGAGTLSISNGGSVSVAGATYVGSYAGSSGLICFGVNGGTLTANSLYAAPTQFAGPGTINTRGLVADADLHSTRPTLSCRRFFFQGSGQNFTVNLDMGSDPAANGDLGEAGTAGSLTIRDGVHVTCTAGYLGYQTGSTGVATVAGSGSTWTVNGPLAVGYLGSGTLSIPAALPSTLGGT